MQTLYTKIGPNRLRTIVDRFYAIVFNDSTIAYLFNTDKSLIRNKQYQFLTHFFLGPQNYTAAHGHPKMRMRHAPHKINNSAKEDWLLHENSYNENIDDPALAMALYECFPKVAAHMVNT